MAPATSPHAARRRSRGVKAGLDLTVILRAAQSLDPDVLTMQAVADELGVDRKAVNHHVSDRGTLLQLVATDAFTTSFAAVRIPVGTDWRTACRIFAFGVADGAIATGRFAEHLRLTSAIKGAVLGSVDAVMGSLLEAGFDIETGMRSIALLSDIALTYGRDMIKDDPAGSCVCGPGVTNRSERGQLRRPGRAPYQRMLRKGGVRRGWRLPDQNNRRSVGVESGGTSSASGQVASRLRPLSRGGKSPRLLARGRR